MSILNGRQRNERKTKVCVQREISHGGEWKMKAKNQPKSGDQYFLMKRMQVCSIDWSRQAESEWLEWVGQPFFDGQKLLAFFFKKIKAVMKLSEKWWQQKPANNNHRPIKLISQGFTVEQSLKSISIKSKKPLFNFSITRLDKCKMSMCCSSKIMDNDFSTPTV